MAIAVPLESLFNSTLILTSKGNTKGLNDRLSGHIGIS